MISKNHQIPADNCTVRLYFLLGFVLWENSRFLWNI